MSTAFMKELMLTIVKELRTVNGVGSLAAKYEALAKALDGIPEYYQEDMLKAALDMAGDSEEG